MKKRTVAILVSGVIAVVGGGLAYRLSHHHITTGIYRERLQSLAQEYEQLRTQYNQAVKKTAVTELVVKQNQLSVVVRTTDGVQQTIPTPFDPNGEVYVDYAVLDGRLWIRRVFDATTPPAQGVVIDPLIDPVDWDRPDAAFGKAVYRRLSQGRWVITVTGDGSLGLAKHPNADPIELATGPAIHDYTQIQQEMDHQIDQIRTRDVLWRLFAPQR